MPTASEIMSNSAALLGDANKVTFTNDKLLPYLKLAYRDLQLKLAKAGVQVLLDTSAESTLSAGDREMDPPDDLLSPIIVEERSVGGGESDWLEVTQKRILPNEEPGQTLNVYAWNEQVFKFLGATEDREVRIKYWRDLDAISGESTNINILNCQLFLEYKTPALYCLFPGGQPKRGADLESKAESYWNDALTIETKNQQGMPARRLPYGYSRRMIGRIRGAI
jgi:hypothetical protein